ncbi:MAG: ATP-dependent helicase [Patescibacteria group bacterium]
MNAEEILKDLNTEQKQAVTYGDGPFLIIAGAGTGKTTVITRRIAWLILSGFAKPEEILAVTFTDKAADEMEERVDKLLPYGYVDLWISTFHSFCERILRNHALDIGLPTNFKLLNQVQQILLIRQNFNRFNLDYYRPLGNPYKFIQSLVKHFSRAKDELIGPEEYFEYAEKIKLNKDSALSDELLDQESGRLKEIADAYHTYQQLLLENSALDFGDLINYTIKLFKERSNILEKYRQQFKYILVDEFQDTNWAQYELLKLLAAPRNNLAVISDDDQAIYRWRGASYNNVLQFKKDFPQAAEVVLIKNYRSKQNILDLAYKFIQLNNPNRLEAQVCSPAAAETGQVGRLAGILKSQICKKLEAVREGGGIIEYLHLASQEKEARKVVEKIIELKERDKDLTWNDFAILVRANNQAENFCQALRWRGIPYQFLAHSGLFSKPIILDILAYLKLLNDYHNSQALYRVLTSPIPAMTRLKNEDLINLVYWTNRKSQSLYQSLKNVSSIPGLSQEAILEINKLLGWLDKHSQLARQQSVGKVLFAFLEDTGYLQTLSQKAEHNGFENLENINWLNQFFKKVEDFEKINIDKSTKNFVETTEMIIESGDEGNLQADLEEEGPEAVKVMTVHGAKGLEFKYVFVVNLVDRRFPTAEKKEEIELPNALIKEIIPEGDIHLQEERRLFYVAMTRAKDGLFFTSAEDYGGTRKKKPSRFLYELGLVSKDEMRPRENGDKVGLDAKISQPLSVLSQPQPAYSLPTKFSFSQLRAFETCPLQYKFNFILRIPCRGKATFSFGQTIHDTLYKFFQRYLEKKTAIQNKLFSQQLTQINADLPSLDELLKIYQECWIEDWYQDASQQEKYKKLGERSLKIYYQEIKNNPPNPEYLELNFNFKLGNHTIKGKIDRVDRLADNSFEIIDYKTGKVKGQDLTLEDKEQLLIYQIAGQNLLREKIKKLTYHYLDDNSKVSFLGSEEDLNQMKEKMIRTIEEIKRSDFPPKPGMMCRSCDFFGICEYRKI